MSPVSKAAVLLLCCVPLTLHGQTTAKQAVHPATCSLSPADAALARNALESYNKGDLEQAKPQLIKLAQTYPCQTELQAAAGMALADSGDNAGALPFLEHAHTQNRNDAAIAFNLGVAVMKSGNTKRAEEIFSNLVKRAPAKPDYHLALAEVQMQREEFAAAAASFEKANAALRAVNAPVSLDMRIDWATALLKNGQPAKAKDLLADPEPLKSAPAQEILAESEEKAGNYTEAVKHFQLAAQLDPSESMIFGFGNEMLQHWSFGSAIDIFKYGVSKYPSSELLQMGLGIAYFGNHSYDLAAQPFQSVLQRSPQNATAAELLGRSCEVASSASVAGCDTLQAFADAHPENAMASLYAASSILHQATDTRDTARAESLLQHSLKADPRLADAWYELGVLQHSRNQWDESAASLEHAVELRPAFPEAHYRLSRAYARLGKGDKAQAEIALQQKYAQQTKDENNRRMQEVITFLTAKN
ncbi:tetratricopeptide repeat protein [Terriglobus albidus]|uniref:Tetratricopeptide repeat protein n=1 Tax=Terriglobus albidus TaxID=1592106 RepID=A0A5B9EDZ2_9BACT|nr:tetratricopeptide repeat protein [Terriglobus albidus]QEE30242.1 tetratricopeptide repeat protein [Terriglobus albidus]